MNTSEKHYQDWLETYVALVLGENKAYTNFRGDVCPGKFLYVKTFCNCGACAKKLPKKFSCTALTIFTTVRKCPVRNFSSASRRNAHLRFFSDGDSHDHDDERIKRG